MKVKVGIRKPSLKKSIAARTSLKRVARHRMGLKAPRGMGWITNPKKAAYNRIYNRTTKGCRQIFLTFVFFVLIVILFAACSPSVQSIQTAIAETQSIWTPVPTQTPYPTYTPLSTFTAIPTATLTPTPNGPAVTSKIIAAFKAAGLEAEEPHELAPQDYRLAPNVCYGVRFLIPSLGPDSGGRLFVCSGIGEQAAVAGYYRALGSSSSAFFSWVFEKGNVILQINGSLHETIARQYETVLNQTVP